LPGRSVFDFTSAPDGVAPFSGNVRLFLDFPPWRLLLNLRGLNRAEYGISALLAFSAEKFQGFNLEDINALLREGQDYKIQIDDESEIEGGSTVLSQLIEKRATQSGIELAFRFLPEGLT